MQTKSNKGKLYEETTNLFGSARAVRRRRICGDRRHSGQYRWLYKLEQCQHLGRPAVPVVDTNYNITFTPALGENEATLIVDAPKGRDANTNVTISDASVKTINLVGARTVDDKYTYFDVGSLKSECTVPKIRQN